MTETELWKWMMEGNYPPGGVLLYEHRTATAILKREVTIKKRTSLHDETTEYDVVWPAGTKVKVIMASRFGHVGLTDDLDSDYGYFHCTQAIYGGPVGYEREPEDLLENITPNE